ncbi:MAG: hypothetical protein ABI091_05325 [Ferruginibacter sp.]
MDKLKIIDEINNAEWGSFGDPLYTYDQVEEALNKFEEQIMGIKPHSNDMINWLLSNSLRLLNNEQRIVLYEAIGERINKERLYSREEVDDMM